jgi:large subunit ribosomal protein L4
LLGRKVGMMRLFTDDGDAVPVTVVDVSNNRVTQVKTQENDGYVALQVTFGSRKASRVTKPQAGHLAKAGVEAGEIIQEFRVDRRYCWQYAAGAAVPVAEVFAVWPEGGCAGHDDRQGLRWHDQAPQLQFAARFARQQPFAQRAGLHLAWRRIRARFPRQEDVRPSGRRHRHHPEPRCVRIDEARQLLLIKGAVPGSKGGFVTVRPAVKAKAAAKGSEVMQLELLNEQGQAASKYDAPETVFGREYNEDLVHQIVVAFQANARQGTRAQKDREQVKHSTKKPFKQKGTGRARAGMTSSPLWRGGGRIFPNSPEENFTQKINKKMYRAGMASILSQLAREGRLAVVDSHEGGFAQDQAAGCEIQGHEPRLVLVIADEVDENLYLASRNLVNVLVVEPRYADPLSLVHYKKVLVTKGAIDKLKEMFA